MRLLLGGDHGDAYDDGHHHGLADQQQETLDLRVAAVFIIFVASLAGVLPPIVWRNRILEAIESSWARVINVFAGSTIAALGVVHVAPVAVEQLAMLPLPVSFDHLGGAVVLCGLFLMVSADGLLSAWVAPAAYKEALRVSLGLLENAESAAAGGAAAAAAQEDKDGVPAKDDCGGGARTSGKDLGGQDHQHSSGRTDGHDQSLSHARHHHHSHVCARSIAERRLMAALAAARRSGGDHDSSGGDAADMAVVYKRRAALLAYGLEVGCVVHSLLIGLAVGLSTTAGRGAVTALTVAVSVHQLIEGVALGSTCARAPLSRLAQMTMALLYALTTPAGVAMGITIAGSYDPESVVAAALTGVFSGLSAGLLLYLGLCQLMMEELSREDLMVRPGLRAAVHIAMMLGGALMCVLALWA